MHPVTVLSIVGSLLSWPPLVAGDTLHRPSYTAVRTAVPPVIDGDLSDPAWRDVEELTGFVQTEPDDGSPAREQTRVKIIYDDDALYVAAVLHDSGSVTTLLTRRDSDLSSGDLLRIAIDSQYDRLTGFAFLVNPSNVQRDFVFHNDVFISASWNAVWDSATTITSDGWRAEVRIPLSQVRFPDKTEQTWGFNISRWNARLREFSHFAHVPRGEAGVVSRFADLKGIRGVRRQRYAEIAPYVVARGDMRSGIENPLVDGATQRVYGGIDAKLGLTPNLTLTGTLNPDFGQVEVDPAVVNLTQFETFFPEHRPFFTEGAATFDFGAGPAMNRWAFDSRFPVVFYSRRIGRAPQRVVAADYGDVPSESTIVAAAKLIGRTPGGWTIGVLDALTDAEEGRFGTWVGVGSSARELEIGRQEVEPMTNYSVVRVTRESERSRVGVIMTGTHRRLSPETLDVFRRSAYFAGLDGYLWNARRDWLLEWLVGSSLVEGSAEAVAETQRSPARYYQRPDAGHVAFDPERRSLSGSMARATLSRESGKWRPNLQIQLLSPGLEINDLGFQPRVDSIYSHAVLYYQDKEVTRSRREVNAWVAKYRASNFDGDTISNGVAGGAYIQLPSYLWGEAWLGRRAATMDDQATRGGPIMIRAANSYAGLTAGTDPQARLATSATGEFVDHADGGYSLAVRARFAYRPTHALTLAVEPGHVRSRTMTQYVTTVNGSGPPATFGNRYVFARIDQEQLELALRGDWTLSSRLSFQMYLQPLIASGRYTDFRELLRPRSAAFGPTPPPLHPDFTTATVRGSAVLRWEFRRGSALYVAWNEQRGQAESFGDIHLPRDVETLAQAPSRDVILVKLSYWLPL